MQLCRGSCCCHPRRLLRGAPKCRRRAIRRGIIQDPRPRRKKSCQEPPNSYPALQRLTSESLRESHLAISGAPETETAQKGLQIGSSKRLCRRQALQAGGKIQLWQVFAPRSRSAPTPTSRRHQRRSKKSQGLQQSCPLPGKQVRGSATRLLSSMRFWQSLIRTLKRQQQEHFNLVAFVRL